MSHDHDREVIGRIARGDVAALTEFYQAHAQVLFNFAARVLQSVDDASEAVSDLFLSTWTGEAGMSGTDRPPGVWLFARMREMLLRRSGEGIGGRPARVVDLWTLVTEGDSGQTGGAPAVPAAAGFRSPAALRESLDRCGAISTRVLSLVYFGGYGISEVAARFSMTPAECRSRLHGCLELLSGGRVEGRKGRPHNGRFSVCSAALALGAILREDDPAYFDHLKGGCPECTAEIARFSIAAHSLPRLLPAVKLPPELLDKILFSLRLALIAGSVPQPGTPGSKREEAASDVPDAAGDGSASFPASPQRGRGRGVAVYSLPAVLVAVIAFLAIHDITLNRKLDARSALLETLQERHTDLILKYDRLAGISGYFESKGVVTVLNGTGASPGLSGKIVWDTTGGSAMLQILDPPDDLGTGKIRVRAVGEDGTVRVVEFTGDERDSGGVFYRFFPLEVAPNFLAEGFTVDVSSDARQGAGRYRQILSGEIPGRQ